MKNEYVSKNIQGSQSIATSEMSVSNSGEGLTQKSDNSQPDIEDLSSLFHSKNHVRPKVFLREG